MTAIVSLETRMQQANNQYGAAAASNLSQGLGGSINAMLDRLSTGYAAFGVSIGSGSQSLPKTSSVATAITGTSVNFSTTGRPVILFLGTTPGTTGAVVETATTNVRFFLYRNGSQIAQVNLGSSSIVTTVPYFWDPNATAGSNTWQLYYSIAGTGSAALVIASLSLIGWQA